MATHGQLFLCLVLLLHVVVCKNNRLSVTLQAQWSDTSIISEASEYVAEESTESFWKFVDILEPVVSSHHWQTAFTKAGVSEFLVDVDTYVQLENLVLDALSSGGKTSDQIRTKQRQLFRLFLSSRTYSPSVEMMQQLAVTSASQIFNCSQQSAVDRLVSCMSGSSWAQVGAEVVCDIAGLSRALDKATEGPVESVTISVTLSREKTFRSNGAKPTRPPPTVVLYGDLGQPDFYTWHKHLKSLTEKGLCSYVFRHFKKFPSKNKAVLSGYGVELALKSTEYKAMDDTKVEEKSSNKEALEAPEDAIVQGFNFTQLRLNHPDLDSQLKEYQKYLLSTDEELRPLKVWQFRELNLQATQAIVDASRQAGPDTGSVLHPGLAVLRDITQNLPSRAGRLVSMTVDSDLRSEVANNQLLLGAAEIQPGQTTWFINGLLLSPTVDVFALLDLLRQELRAMSRLYNLGVPAGRISELLTMTGSFGQSISDTNSAAVPGLRYSLSGRFVLDLSGSPVIYLNNLESDSAYATWPESLQMLFIPDFSGGIRRIRRNLYNIILVLDPGSTECQEIIRLAESFLLHRIAIRFGLLWSVDSSVKSLSLILVRMFTYISSVVSHFGESPLPVGVSGLGSPGPMTALSFLTELYAEAERTKKELTITFIQQRFEKLFPNADIEEIISPEAGASEYDSQLHLHHEFLRRSGLSTIDNAPPLLLFNGIILDRMGLRKMGGFEDAVVTLCMEEMMNIQHAVYHGQMSTTDTIFNLYQKRNAVVPRFNPRILATSATATARYLEFGMEAPRRSTSDGPPTSSELLTYFVDHMRYLQKGDLESAVRPVTVWIVVGDLDAIFDNPQDPARRSQLEHDLGLVRTAVTHLRSAHASKDLRVGLVYNPPIDSWKSPSSSNRWLTRVLHLIGHPVRIPAGTDSPRLLEPRMKLMEQMAARNFANKLIKEALEALNSSSVLKPLSELVVSGVNIQTLETAIQALDRAEFLHGHSIFCQQILGFKSGERAVVINGRIIGPLNPTEEFTVDDFRLIERMTLDTGVKELGNTLLDFAGEGLGGPEAISELTWQVSAMLPIYKEASSTGITDIDTVEGILSKNRVRIKALSINHSGFFIPSNTGELAFDVLAIVNPGSRDAQRLSHVLAVVQQALPCNMRVVFNPSEPISELPVKNGEQDVPIHFYRFVWEPSVFVFESSISTNVVNEDPIVPRALFTHLPGQPVLTLGMDTPHGWMVAAVEAVHDLDNLRLADVHNVVEAVFELEHLLLEGHCFEQNSMKPPRGLQLTLGPASDLERHDTIVMANLGYFQLKAGPGSWHLNIRAGRSREFYTMADEEDVGTSLGSFGLLTTIDNFRSKIISVRVTKRPERMTENLLDESEKVTSKKPEESWSWLYKNSQVWSTLSDYAEAFCPSWLTSLRKSLQTHLPWQKCSHKVETINVFSLASGHLYERLLRIMMLTVIRHTKSPVKFWFLKNYLSPTFKDFIPHMAAEYGFEYELVQYQWPRWLHAQTEKQRIIWGHKILFLDVLFPLNVTKIIFVDADQIVRADLQELVDLDLQGAPYGYTPFCDSRKEMDGFRFWKHGYWANHLAGRPYHISALYVVDLTRFRQLAAGDRLRGQYHGLSQDPNSLSNLDQDLPNNMIHQVPIKSLPQEWLWCETWCSDESKARAKTIDLCNNPQTKEPKLSAAMRIAPEWVGYDREIKNLWKRVYPTSGTSTESATTDKETVVSSPSNPTEPTEVHSDYRSEKTEL
ncbi:hypothetical protein CRM22_007650 [Opisthorchis felineus]|uniref:UDP-glucose:glycoprotein glucosyltransferase n=1 Tax=Opisthorchis felineus TaxID=147828 RepID=A0A4S2LFM2_OPIFE|nr:hypothetical protein CRM22_007650 [Opisthorchis felineus]